MPKVQTLEDIRRLIAAGARVDGAIKEAIAQDAGSLTAFAVKHGIDRGNLSRAVNGAATPTTATLSVFTRVFGGTEIEWRQLFHEAGRPSPVAAAV
jgi:hypothetical protein